MYLIVGLGNQGEKYQKTRHNVGAMAVEQLETLLNQRDILLVLPTTFMNESGPVVARAVKEKKIALDHLVVVHDDLDLLLGMIRVRKGSRAAGHRGVESVIQALGGVDFWRVRIGTGPRRMVPAERYVLQSFAAKEQPLLRRVLDQVVKTILELIDKGFKATSINLD